MVGAEHDAPMVLLTIGGNVATASDTWRNTPETRKPPLSKEWDHAILPHGARERLEVFVAILKEEGATEVMHPFLETLRQSFIPTRKWNEHLWRKRAQTSGDTEFKHRYLNAICELANEWGRLLPVLLWETLAALGTREDVHRERAILDIADELPYPWYISDAAIHATGKTYPLLLAIETAINRHTGTVLLHDCGCNHLLPELPDEPVIIRYQLPKRQRERIAVAFLDHLLSEAYAIVRTGLPFRMNPAHMRSTEVLGLRFLGIH